MVYIFYAGILEIKTINMGKGKLRKHLEDTGVYTLI
jgi:hypothetical protein